MSAFDVHENSDRVVDVRPLAGTDVRKCIWEALEVVRVIGGSVRFKHNGVVLIVDGSTLYGDLYDKWQNELDQDG